MAINSIYRSLQIPNGLKHPTNLFLTTKFSNTTKPSNCDPYWKLLQQNTAQSSNLERTLTKVNGKLDSSIVEQILKKSMDKPQLGLRFFIWAGLQSDYRHSAFMYNKAGKLFRIKENPLTLISVLEEYRKDGAQVSVKTFKVILNLCKEAKLAEEALLVLRKMGEFGCCPDTTMFNVVIRLFSEKGKMGVAQELMKEMGLVNLYPDMITYVAMVKGYCDVGLLEEACGLFKVMRGHGCFPNIVAYSALLDGACKHGDLDKAMELLGEMEKEAGGKVPNVVTYTSVIQSFCREGRTREALKVLDQMKDHGCLPNRVTVSTLITGFCVEGDVEKAYDVVEKVVSGGSLTSSMCYSLLVLSLLQIKNVEEAKKVFSMMLASGMKPDGLACSSLIKQLCYEGQILDGFNCFGEMEKIDCLSSVDTNVYSVLLEGICQQGHIVEAAKLVNVMIERRIQLRAPHVDVVVEYLQKLGERELSLRLMSIA